MARLPSDHVDLVVTSPPYPMIEMWDPVFTAQDPEIARALEKGEGIKAFEAMHKILDRIWLECFRVLKPGGFACINIGDATRSVRDEFCLYTNHARILSSLLHMGFSPLPCIIWRKQTNAPNKFMGSGMLPAGAYVTLEHEYILILRKGGKRLFKTAGDKKARHQSALFWEERNTWFSDVWLDIKGTVQATGNKAARQRSGAYPFDLAYRLINMYSVKNDLVLDPFLGTGTTMAAAMASARNSLGYERDQSFEGVIRETAAAILPPAREMIRSRLVSHLQFAAKRMEEKKPMKHHNRPYGFPVITAQEKELIINTPIGIKDPGPSWEVDYDPAPQAEFCRDWSSEFKKAGPALPEKKSRQKSLF